MYFSPAILSFFTASMASATSALASAEAIQEAIGDGCVNTLQFQSTFKTDAGDTCSTCNFCEGSHLSSLFNPKIKNVCIECGTADNSCNALEVVTDFENTWLMDFIALSSSNMGSENDPFKIIIKASDDSNTWTTIHDSEVVFAERNNGQLFLLNNNNQYKKYSILFQRKSASAYMNLGQYGIVESYTKRCTADFYASITGDTVLPYETVSPTSKPTTLAPTVSPTSKPTTLAPTNPIGPEFTDLNTLKIAVRLWTSDEPKAIEEHGDIKYWDTAKMTSLHKIFQTQKSFNGDISLWNTSRVTDMGYMFYMAENFNADISLWDTSNVVLMLEMFYQAKAFNVDISGWNTGKTTTMQKMFVAATAFNIDVSEWDVSEAKNMYMMFAYNGGFNQTLCWDMTGKNEYLMFRDSPGSTGCD